MNGLKPCPFCGKKAIIERWSSGGRMYMAKCSNPDCGVPDYGYPAGHNLDKVIDEWNRRASDEQVDQRG